MIDESLFLAVFGFFWVALAWLGFFLAVLGIFYKFILILYFFGSSGLIFFLYFRHSVFKVSRDFKLIFALSFFIAAAAGFFVTPTVFSGRDQGSISQAAIELSKNNDLSFSTPASQEFFKIYPAPKQKFDNCMKKILEKNTHAGSIPLSFAKVWCGASAPGKALNFPGFYYQNNGDLIAQFPLPYISWLAIFYSMFGLYGLIIANAILLVIFLSAFYLILKTFFNPLFSFLGYAVAATSFPIFWFYKFTLSENMALGLLWFLIFLVLSLMKKVNTLAYFTFFATAILLALTRIEGIAFLVLSLAVLWLKKDVRNYALQNKKMRIYFPLLVLVTVFIIAFFANYPFFKEIAKAAASYVSDVNSDSQGGSSIFYNLKVFYLYGIIQLLIFGIFGMAYLLYKQAYLKLVPLAVTFPVFVYLINSNISSDHPWMLRRFSFALVPIIIFYSFCLIEEIFDRKRQHLTYFFAIMLIVMNLPVFFRYFFVSENKTLLEQTRELSDNFSKFDLVLVNRLASGDPWSMIAGPMESLYGKQAVYFFNPADFEKIDPAKFENVYLVVPDNGLDFYRSSQIGFYLTSYRQYDLKTSRLEPGSDPGQISGLKNVEITGRIYKIDKGPRPNYNY